MLNNENEIIHDLYALRAGLSVISKLKDDAAIQKEKAENTKKDHEKNNTRDKNIKHST